ncbi:hypothetical protein DSO57_1027203, partial [Entomophthora muscae]
KNGSYIRGLIIKNIQEFNELRSFGLFLCEVFPNLRSISLDLNTHVDCNIESFVLQCLALKHLKHLSLLASGFRRSLLYPEDYSPDDEIYIVDPYAVLNPLLSKLESIYTSFWPKTLFAEIANSETMKTLYISTGFHQHTILDLVDLPRHKEVIFTNEYGPVISSTNATGQNWLHFTNSQAHFFVLLSHKDFSNPDSANQRIKIFPTLDHLEDHADLDRLIDMKAANHCTVVDIYNAGMDLEIFDGVQDIPSLELVFRQNMCDLALDESKFQTKKLSLVVVDDEPSEFFEWVLYAFPGLKHFFVHNEFPDEMIPFDNLFPCLTHFYSSVEQSPLFWEELIDKSPKIVYLHTDTEPENFLMLKEKNPNLQIMPFEEIFGAPRDFNDVSGFNKSLYL